VGQRGLFQEPCSPPPPLTTRWPLAEVCTAASRRCTTCHVTPARRRQSQPAPRRRPAAAEPRVRSGLPRPRARGALHRRAGRARKRRLLGGQLHRNSRRSGHGRRDRLRLPAERPVGNASREGQRACTRAAAGPRRGGGTRRHERRRTWGMFWGSPPATVAIWLCCTTTTVDEGTLRATAVHVTQRAGRGPLAGRGREPSIARRAVPLSALRHATHRAGPSSSHATRQRGAPVDGAVGTLGLEGPEHVPEVALWSRGGPGSVSEAGARVPSAQGAPASQRFLREARGALGKDQQLQMLQMFTWVKMATSPSRPMTIEMMAEIHCGSAGAHGSACLRLPHSVGLPWHCALQRSPTSVFFSRADLDRPPCKCRPRCQAHSARVRA